MWGETPANRSPRSGGSFPLPKNGAAVRGLTYMHATSTCPLTPQPRPITSTREHARRQRLFKEPNQTRPQTLTEPHGVDVAKVEGEQVAALRGREEEREEEPVGCCPPNPVRVRPDPHKPGHFEMRRGWIVDPRDQKRGYTKQTNKAPALRPTKPPPSHAVPPHNRQTPRR